MKFFISALLFLSASFTLADDVSGTWKGEDYSFTFYSSDITGEWGDLEYDINFWSSDIDGEVASQDFDINFWSSDIDGELPCGDFDFNIWSSEVDGEYCGSDIEIDTDSREESVEVAFDLAISSLLEYVPFPARSALRVRINQERAERGWMTKKSSPTTNPDRL